MSGEPRDPRADIFKALELFGLSNHEDAPRRAEAARRWLQRQPTVGAWLRLEADAAERESELETLEEAVLEAEQGEVEEQNAMRQHGLHMHVLGLRIAAGIMGLEVGKDPGTRDTSKLLSNQPMVRAGTLESARRLAQLGGSELGVAAAPRRRDEPDSED